MRLGLLVLRTMGDWNQTPGWEWLPNSHDEMEPFHTTEFNECVTVEEKGIFRETLKSLRRLPASVPGLVSGPHDFTLAARNGSLRRAHGRPRSDSELPREVAGDHAAL